MSPKIILTNILIIIFVGLFENSFEECLCNVRLRGEYCGTELNRRNGNTDCETNIYYCGEHNRNKGAIVLTKCRDESECSQNQFRRSFRTRSRNSCLRGFRCQCPRGIGRGPHCGDRLIGDDCPPNVVFTCRLFNGISARDACPQGCSEGKCIDSTDVESDGEREQDSDSDNDSNRRQSDDESDKEP